MTYMIRTKLSSAERFANFVEMIWEHAPKHVPGDAAQWARLLGGNKYDLTEDEQESLEKPTHAWVFGDGSQAIVSDDGEDIFELYAATRN